MSILIFNVMPAILAALIASAQRRHALIWFIAGLLFSYLAVFAVLIAAYLLPAMRGGGAPFGTGGRRRKTSRQCPYCGEDVIFDDSPGNWRCPNCGQTFVYSTDGRVYKMRSEQLQPQIEWIVRMFAKLAKADGAVSEQEIIRVDQIIRQSFRPTREQLHRIMDIFNEARYSSESFEDLAENLMFSVGAQRDSLVDLLTALLAVAYADGALRTEEDAMIRLAARIFGLDQVYEQIKRRFNGGAETDQQPEQTLDEAYRLLGCKPDDSVALVKKRYRQQIKDNHPDRLVSSNASEQDIKAANVKIAAIKNAYEQIMAARG
ncbi:MAG: TerB family tellurite resistance protein [Sporolactobacillus sp.]